MTILQFMTRQVEYGSVQEGKKSRPHHMSTYRTTIVSKVQSCTSRGIGTESSQLAFSVVPRIITPNALGADDKREKSQCRNTKEYHDHWYQELLVNEWFKKNVRSAAVFEHLQIFVCVLGVSMVPALLSF